MTPTHELSSHLEEQDISNPPEEGPQTTRITTEEGDIDRTKLEDATTLLDTESDYGDFANDAEELEIIDSLLLQAEKGQGPEASSLLVTDIEDYEPPKGVRLPKILGVEQSSRQWEVLQDTGAQHPGLVQLEDGSKVSDRDRERAISAKIDPPSTEVDTRPPIERFRRAPKKALSVTDLVSPSWCELQYFYTLTKHGRKKRTPAMKQGTKVHQALEDEVHRTVPVTITKKEDSWGLRLWNIIQGLRTLRDTGRTRELEIWGTVGGEIVNGVIDELSYNCPDPTLEEEFTNPRKKTGPVADDGHPEYQTSITDYLLAAGGRKDRGQSISSAMLAGQPLQRSTPKEGRIYITDVKTRGHPTLPAGASIRPTVLQLHLYHHMLENLAQGNFALTQLAERYQLNVNETFSDSFIAQIGGLNQEIFEIASSQEDGPADRITASQIASSQDSMDVLLRHNNLESLWGFMMAQFQDTFLLPPTVTSRDEALPSTQQSTSDLAPPAALPTRLSPLLTAEYLAPTYKHVAGTAKQSIGSKSFHFNAAFLRAYLEDNLAWWRGERPAKGVELQEAWKCRSCDFRGDCEWIHERDAAALAQAEERRKMRESAGVNDVVGMGKTALKGTWEV